MITRDGGVRVQVIQLMAELGGAAVTAEVFARRYDYSIDRAARVLARAARSGKLERERCPSSTAFCYRPVREQVTR